MVEKGSIIRVEYEAWTEDGDLFDTTKKDVAKEQGQVDENVVYAPLPVIVGIGRVLPGFDKALLEADVGEEREIEVPPQEAFGEKDSSKIETVSLREFEKQDVRPHPGMRLNVRGKPATVVNVTAGRVRLDFNPPLAGKGLRYKFKITEKIEDLAEQVTTVLELDYKQGSGDEFEVTTEDKTVTIKVPERCKYDQRWFVAKYRVVSDLRTYADVETIRFVEEYTNEPFTTPEAEEAVAEPATSAEEAHETTEAPEAAKTPEPNA